ncbi:Imm1 family immunity protein [Kistimonas asteriae]|uniref:Imm1 family immunity protein n=1 Tax=Kistimonas asteriae TaxID=517724 RepID=UPI001BA7E21E|nr:Imm1 family immunity protein [Kistimonas asteriae]
MNSIDLINKIDSPQQFKEIWLSSPTGQKLCALINGDIGWLMYLRSESDTGFSSRNPAIKSEKEIEYCLSNGEENHFPEKWAYPIATIKEAMLYFINTSNRPHHVIWHDDSQP